MPLAETRMCLHLVAGVIVLVHAAVLACIGRANAGAVHTPECFPLFISGSGLSELKVDTRRQQLRCYQSCVKSEEV